MSRGASRWSQGVKGDVQGISRGQGGRHWAPTGAKGDVKGSQEVKANVSRTSVQWVNGGIRAVKGASQVPGD